MLHSSLLDALISYEVLQLEFKTLHFLGNLRTGPISVCPLASLSYLICQFKLRSVVNTVPGPMFTTFTW